MEKQINADFDLTYNILNYLTAQYRAHYAFLNALLQLGGADVTKDEIAVVEKDLKSILKWNKDLFAGMPIFSTSWRYPEGFEAQQAFQLLEAIKLKIDETASKLHNILIQGKISDQASYHHIIGCFVRYTYGRENFIKGFIQLAKHRNEMEKLPAYERELVEASEDIKKSMVILKEYKAKGELTADSYETLNEIIDVLPSMLRSYMLDIDHLLSTYREDLSFEECGVLKAQSWQASGFTPLMAGYWNIYLFDAAAASGWIGIGIGDACTAFLWRKYGFAQQESAAWVNLGLTPKLARQLSLAGQTPDTVYNAIIKEAQRSAA